MGIAKATIRNLATNRSIEVPFNPEEYSLDSANKFKTQDVPKGRPTVQFTGTNLRRLQMDLFVDTSQSQTDVRSQVQPILELLEKDATTDAPPVPPLHLGELSVSMLARERQPAVHAVPHQR